LPCALKCRWLQTVSLTDYEGRATDRHIVVGQSDRHLCIDDRFIRDGLLGTGSMRPITRAGYHEYDGTPSKLRFSMRRPTSVGGQS
jgi:hypothetical protein